MALNRSRGEACTVRFRKLLEERQARPTESVAAFCKSHRISQSAYFYWKKKLSLSAAESPPTNIDAFIPVTISPPSIPNSTYEIRFSNGTHLVIRPGFDHNDVAALVNILLHKDARCLG